MQLIAFWLTIEKENREACIQIGISFRHEKLKMSRQKRFHLELRNIIPIKSKQSRDRSNLLVCSNNYVQSRILRFFYNLYERWLMFECTTKIFFCLHHIWNLIKFLFQMLYYLRLQASRGLDSYLLKYIIFIWFFNY